MGVLPILVLSALCLLNPASAENEAECYHNGKVASHGEIVTDGCMICECDNGEIKDCIVKADCIPKISDPQIHDVDFKDDPNVIESSDGKRLKRSLGGMLNSLGNVNVKSKDSGGKSGASVEVKLPVLSGGAGINIPGIGGNAGLKGSISGSEIGGKSGASVEVQPPVLSGGANVNIPGIGGSAGLKSSISGSEIGGKGGASVDVKLPVLSGGADVKIPGIGGNAELKSSISGSQKDKFKVGGGFGLGNGSHGEKGNVDINIQGGIKKSSHRDNGNFKLGGGFGLGNGSHGEKGNVDINIQGGIKKSSQRDKDHSKSGGKHGYGQGSDKEYGKINIHINGGKKNDSKEFKGHGHGSYAEHEKHEGKHSGSQHSSVEAELPEEPQKPTESETPEEPQNPTEAIKPAPTQPSVGESCIFNKESLVDGQTVELDCVTCECNDGSLTCVKNMSCPGICSVTGYQMIRTFDGTLYETPGTCNYVLTKTKDFTITLNNKLCSELQQDVEDPEAVCIESVDVYIASKANIKLQSDGSILVAGEKSPLPYSVLDTITVLRSSSVFVDLVSQEFKLQYDFAGNRLYVFLDASYKDATNGLCGTYNDNRNDDYRSSCDITETVSSLFSKSWKTQFQCSESERSQEDRDKKVQADLTCSGALDSSMFEDCALLIDTHSYKLSCSQSLYYGGSIGFCTAMADYAYRCAHAGIIVSVGSTFTDCTPVCEGDMVFATEDTFSQEDCAEFSIKLQKITSSIPLNEACICPPDLYYDASSNTCVDGDSCPCYVRNSVYQIGEIITQPDGQTCPCERVLECGEPEQPAPPEVESCSDNEIYSDCLVGYGKTCEPSCQNMAVVDQVCTLECQPGCVCKTGLLRSSDGTCVPLNECPCVHGDDVYNPGETLAQDCNTCSCSNGKFVCTNNPCNKVCNAYAGSQFFLFDGVWKTFTTGHCEIVLVESLEDESPSFSVVMQNTANEDLGGALLRKIITIKFGETTVVLSDSDPVVLHGLGAKTEFRTYRSGFYVVVHFLGLFAVYYDQHLDVIIQLEPKLQGKVQGMCGDADGTTTSEVEISNMAQYASRFLVGECPDDENPLPPPSEHHKKFVENRCSLLKSDDFAECHNAVNVESYYMACVEETEACREGESCLCYCTALAAYARACCRKGITVEWRSPDTCPSPCEYYNRDAGEGPYRLVMINGKSLVADYDSSSVLLKDVNAPDLKASFMVTRGLFVDPLNGRKLISLESAQHHNFFIVQNDDGTLSLRKWQSSVDFRSQATFILRPSRWVKGFDALESYVSRGNYLSLNNNGLVMSRVRSGNMLQMNFKLVEETFGLPSFSICTWKYKACGNPCIPTCQDPLGTKCTLTLKVEGCYPLCAPGMVFDEVTHRCVQLEDCVTLPPVTPPSQTPPPGTPPPGTPPPETLPPGTPPPETLPPGTPPPETLPPGTPPPETPPPGTPPPETTPPQTPAPPVHSTPKPACSGRVCPPEPECFMQGSRKVLSNGDDPCCPEVDCVCDPCSPPPDCGPNGLLSKTIDPEIQCCFTYNCTGTNQPPPQPTPAPCEHVVCEPPLCKQGAELTVSTSVDNCCPRMECQCKECPPFPTCTYGVPITKEDPNAVCCPEYACPPPPLSQSTTAPPSENPCANHPCPTIKCAADETKVEIVGNDPCCNSYICIPPPPSPTPTAPQVCDTSDCQDRPTCKEGENLFVKNDPDRVCCSLYECIPSVTPTPEIPVPTTQPDICKDIQCMIPDCAKEDSKPVVIGMDGYCCFKYECVCDPCQPVPFCHGYQPLMYFNPDKACCPRYDCPAISTPPSPPTQPPTIPVLSTTQPPPPLPCLNVVCESITCTKTGEIPVVIEPPSETRCCPVLGCECEKVCPPPTCDDGSPALLLGDLKAECCPEYECPPPTQSTTTPPSGCSHVHCPLEPTCEESDIKVQIPSDNECCKEYLCVPPPVTPTTPPVPPCQGHSCQPQPDCKADESILEKVNPTDSCCPLYECLPPTPPTTPPVQTTLPDYCWGVTCTVHQCTRYGEKPVPVASKNQCCPEYECECSPCPPAPDCGEYTVIVDFIPESCCPSYRCPPITTSPSPPTQPPTILVLSTTLPPPPLPCLNVVCESITCTKTGEIPVMIEPPSETRCCPVLGCECEKVCPPPTCDDGSPALLLGDFEAECCPEYECPPPTQSTTTPPSGCSHVHCPLEPTCDESDIKVQIPSDNECCKEYLCVPPPVTPTTPPVPPCQGHSCQPQPDCKADETILEKVNPTDSCCPLYECLPPTPPTTPPVLTTLPDYCWGVTCTVHQCTRYGEKPVPVASKNQCCPEYECECSPCPPAPDCGEYNVIVDFIPESCCPSYSCPPITTPPSPPTQPPTILVLSTTLPPPPLPCLNVVCESITCTKTGEIPVMIEPPSETRCCPVLGCECEKVCPPPTCDDGSPALLLGDLKAECCPEYECPPPTQSTTTPPSGCSHVHCPLEPTCEESDIKVQIPSDNECCKEYLCVPPPVTPTTPPVPPCQGHSCQPQPDCKADETILEKVNPTDICCPLYECLPPTPPTTPPVLTTLPDHCWGVTCTVHQCTRYGEEPVPVASKNQCCPEYECECSPCPPAPDCGEYTVIVDFIPESCCPSYSCPPPVTSQPPPTPSPTPLIPTPPPPCWNVLCPSVSCAKTGEVPVVVEPSSATRCCPVIDCACQDKCYIPTCEDDRPPLLLGNPETECCPEHRCPPPPTPPPFVCSQVTCAPEPLCGENEYKIESPTDDICCKAFFCVPIPPTPTPPPTKPPCESSGCPPADCNDGDKVIEVPDKENPCCPAYICIPPPPTTTPAPTTTPSDECYGIICNVPQCLRNGEKPVQVSTSEPCCPEYECQCDPCRAAPFCGNSQPIVTFNVEAECCPIYECPPPPATTTPLPRTTPPPEQPTPSQPPNPPPCLGVFCPPVSCTKTGEVPVVVEPSSATRCCPVINCVCQEQCQIPTCEDDRPPLLLGNPQTECCPEYQCPPPPTPPPPKCSHVTCSPEPECSKNEVKIESPTDDICCKAYFCVPIPTPPVTVPSEHCESSGCPPADCNYGDKVVEVPDKENPCCPSYICIPPPTPTKPTPTTTPSDECYGVTCNVPQCLRNGEKPVQVPTSDPCCPAYECQCDPCPAAPYCGDNQPIVTFNLEEECCPIYRCPPTSVPQSTPPTITTIITSTTNVCKDRICPIKQCKDYEHLVTSISPIDPCCPTQTCECTCKTIPACAHDERLVAVHQNNQCCPKLKCERKKDECHPVNTVVKLKSGQCSANVMLNSCSGYCHSKTEYSSLWAPVSECRCCSVSSTRSKKFELPCPDGTRVQLTVLEALRCGCHHCSGDGGSGEESGSGSGSGEEGSGLTLWSEFQGTN